MMSIYTYYSAHININIIMIIIVIQVTCLKFNQRYKIGNPSVCIPTPIYACLLERYTIMYTHVTSTLN